MTTSNTIRRYNRTPKFGLGYRYGTSFTIPVLRENINNGNIRFSEYVLAEGERLDTLAGKFYGDGSLYWVIAAVSNIGNVSQVPPGTLILIPNLDDAIKFLG